MDPRLLANPQPVPDTDRQDRHWSRAAARYDDLFLDPFRPGVENPLLDLIGAVAEPGSKAVADLGCGTGPLLPHLVARFGRVVALDFAPGMITKARKRLGDSGERVEFLVRPMHELDDFQGALDVAVAVNSIVMPDVRAIDRTPPGDPLGVEAGAASSSASCRRWTRSIIIRCCCTTRRSTGASTSRRAERHAAFQGEHHYYEFAFGRFEFPRAPPEVLDAVRGRAPPDQGRLRPGRAGEGPLSLGRHHHRWPRLRRPSPELGLGVFAPRSIGDTPSTQSWRPIPRSEIPDLRSEESVGIP